MTNVTLKDLFRSLDGKHFDNRMKFEAAVVDVVNRHLADLPVGYSYKDAVDGARAEKWLETNGGGHGVKVKLPPRAPVGAR